MKVLKKELRFGEGEISLITESLDDLWHLKYILEPGDLVFAFTKRRIEGATDKLRPEKADKRTVRLGITVEKVEFHKFSNRLRVHGTILEGIDTGAYHTVNIEEGTNLSIVKKWKKRPDREDKGSRDSRSAPEGYYSYNRGRRGQHRYGKAIRGGRIVLPAPVAR